MNPLNLWHCSDIWAQHLKLRRGCMQKLEQIKFEGMLASIWSKDFVFLCAIQKC